MLTEHQRLPTSGARGVAFYTLGNVPYLAIPQLAQDVPETPAHMNGGDSNVTAPIYGWDAGKFVLDDKLSVPGGEDIEYFTMDGVAYLATASVRTGHGPYEYNVDQKIYRRVDNRWVVIQSIRGFAAKQWRFFTIGKRRFLALAQGVTLPHIEAVNPRSSCVFEWRGSQFEPFTPLEGLWGYNWEHFELENRHFLGYADHAGRSVLYEWRRESFAPAQNFADSGGRCFRFLTAGDSALLAFANIRGESTLYRWDGAGFRPHQVLSGPGGREFSVMHAGGRIYLVQVNFIEGEPSAPRTDLMSRIYVWNGDKMELAEEFPTFGGTDAAAFQIDSGWWLAISNSLSREVRFRTDTVIYRVNV